MIKVNDLHKHYQSHVISALSFEINPGEIWMVHGPSGCGKSTLLHILGLLEPFDQGQYWFEGQNVRDLNETQKAFIRNQHIGFMFQSYHLLAHLTVLDNVALPLCYRHLTWKVARQHALSRLKEFNLDAFANRKPLSLSGGQRQRVALARALVTMPSIILADEPTGALDPMHSEQLMHQLLALNQRQNLTLVIVTHDPHLLKWAHHRICMESQNEHVQLD